MFTTLRHAGVLIKDINEARKTYEALGFVADPAGVETLKVLKMKDRDGNMIELVQGRWHPHLAVNWYEGPDGNYIETVEDRLMAEIIKSKREAKN